MKPNQTKQSILSVKLCISGDDVAIARKIIGIYFPEVISVT